MDTACTLHIRIRQRVDAPASVPIVYATYTVAELAALWHRSPSSIRVWLSTLRRDPARAPRPPYVYLRRVNAVRRHLEIRSDYAQLLRAIFIDHTLAL